jgi:hypothetical protein
MVGLLRGRKTGTGRSALLAWRGAGRPTVAGSFSIAVQRGLAGVVSLAPLVG